MGYPDRPDDRTRRLDPYAGRDERAYNDRGYDDRGYGARRNDDRYDDRGYEERPRYRPPQGRERRPSDRPEVNGGRLWAGGVVSAVVAALIGVVGLFIARGLLGIPVYLPQHDHTVLNADSVYLGLSGFIAGLVATAVLHALMLSTPRPKLFFQWILGLVVVLAVIWPFTVEMELYSQIATAVISLVMGLAIGSLLSGISTSAVRQPSYRNYPPNDSYGYR